MKTELIKEDDEFLYLNLFDEKSEFSKVNALSYSLKPVEVNLP